MRSAVALVLVFFVFCSIACARAAAQTGDNHQKLIQSFVDALNSKSKDKITAFVNENCTQQIGSKVDRMVQFSQIGAPFKVVTVEDDGKGGLQAKLQDTNNVPVTLNMSFSGDEKVSALTVRVGDVGPSKDYSGWTDLHALTEAIRSDNNAPAMAVAVLHDGKIEATASGIREVGKTDEVQADEPFSIGSIGKPLCSTIIGKLIEMGKLRWDETLAEALPNMPMKDGYRKVTIEQVLHHRGGIPEDPGMRRPEVQRIVNGATDPVKIRDNYVKDVLSRDPIGKPNEKFAYSNGGYAVLGHIAETIMKKPYESLVKEMIFQPLGMTHSYTSQDPLPAARPSGHVKDDPKSDWQPVNMNGPIEYMFAPAGGGMYCSAADLVKFGEMHMNGLNGADGLLKAATIQRLHHGIPEDLELSNPADLQPSYQPTPDARLYACGWGIEADPGIEIMHTHNGSNGTMRAQLAIFPKSHIVVAAFVNCGGEDQPSPPLQACLAIAQRYAKQ